LDFKVLRGEIVKLPGEDLYELRAFDEIGQEVFHSAFRGAERQEMRLIFETFDEARKQTISVCREKMAEINRKILELVKERYYYGAKIAELEAAVEPVISSREQ